MKAKLKLSDEKRIFIALAIGFLIFYFGLAYLHAFIFKESSFIQELTFSTGNLSDVVVNLLVLSEFAGFGVLLYKLFKRRNRSEKMLRESEQLWATTLTSIGDAVIATDEFGRITVMNSEAEKLTGWTVGNANHQPIKTVFKPVNEQTRREVDDPVAKVFETGQVVALANHTVLVRRDGSEVAIDDSAAPIKDNDKNLRGVVLVFRDITERRKAEQALKDLKDFNESIVESICESVLVIDPSNYCILSANGEASRELKISKEDLIGMTCYEATHNRFTPCDLPHRCPLQDVLQTGQAAKAEHLHFDKDQNEINVEIAVYPVRDCNGNIVRVIHVARDITEKKKAEEKISFQADLLNHVGQAIMMVDENREIQFWNAGAEKLYGWIEKDVLGHDIAEILGSKSSSENEQEVSSRLVSGETWSAELQVKRRDGSFVPVIVNRAPIFNCGIYLGAVTIATDITERKKAEEALATSEGKYRALVENADDAILLSDLTGNIIYRNPAYFKQLGFEGGTSDAFAKLHPDDLPSIRKQMAYLMETGFSTSEYRVRHRDGSYVYRFARSTLIYNKNKKPYALLSIIRDMTKQKLAEQQLIENHERMEAMNEKLRVVGSLTRHDVRNKLSAVTGYAYLLKKKHADLPDLVDALGKMERAIAESVRIFDFAKMYEQLGVEELTYIDVEAKLNEAGGLFSGPLPNIDNECHGLTVLADSFLRQLFFNFIDNTIKYGQKATIIKVYYEKGNQDSLKLIYEDNGVGVPLENKSHLFKEGFTTGGSTGFGLFLIKKMMDVYGWNIEENGEPEKGSKFIITIPKKNLSTKDSFRIANS